jgi:cell division protein FtsB
MLDIDDKIRSHQQQLAVITEQANVLQTKINNLQNFTDPDLIEELIRDKFNLSNENDIIIQLE